MPHRIRRPVAAPAALAASALAASAALTVLAAAPAHAAVDEQLTPVCAPALPIAHPGCASGRTYRGALLPSLDENGDPTILSLAGADRWETAAQAAEHGFPEADVVVLASGEDAHLVDALSAAPLARSLAAPVLLTRASVLPEATVHYLRTHAVRSVLLVGGTGAIDELMPKRLATLGVTSVGRVDGADRYETSRELAALMPRAEHAWVASGENGNLVDALAAAGPAAFLTEPVVVVPRTGDATAAASVLAGLGVTGTTVAGGPGAVSDDVLRQMPGAVRAGGPNRYFTAWALAEAGVDRGVPFDDLVFASGRSGHLVDALAGAPLGRVTLLLDDVEDAYAIAEAYLDAHGAIRETFIGAAG